MQYAITQSEEEWKEDEKRENYLCFIGRNLNKE